MHFLVTGATGFVGSHLVRLLLERGHRVTVLRRQQSPLRALEGFDTPLPVLHIYAQPGDAAYWDSQQFFAKSHPWFSAKRVNALSHLPMLEAPEEVAEVIESFVASK